jgi:hypothetical protein
LFITTTLEQIMARHNPNATTMTEILEYLTENGLELAGKIVDLISINCHST